MSEILGYAILGGAALFGACIVGLRGTLFVVSGTALLMWAMYLIGALK